jgi:hypothetical protein
MWLGSIRAVGVAVLKVRHKPYAGRGKAPVDSLAVVLAGRMPGIACVRLGAWFSRPPPGLTGAVLIVGVGAGLGLSGFAG